jgi:hypothetical protein
MLQLALAVWGIYVMVTGKLKVAQNKVVVGTPARLLALLMLAPLPVGFTIGIGVGVWAGANGKELEDIQIPLFLTDVALVIGTAVVVFCIAHAIGKPPAQQFAPPPWQGGYGPQPSFPPPPPASPPADPNNPYHPPQV